MFALRTTIVCEPMSEAIVLNSFLNIGLITAFVRRANTRFDPTLVLLIGLIPVFVRGEHKVRPYIGFGHWLDFDYYDLPEN